MPPGIITYLCDRSSVKSSIIELTLKIENLHQLLDATILVCCDSLLAIVPLTKGTITFHFDSYMDFQSILKYMDTL